MRFYLMRHGKTLWNVEGRYIGRTDLPLCEQGIMELQDLRYGGQPSFNRIYSSPMNRIYSSPMKRCVETVEIIFPNMDYKIEDKIRERDFGIFEGKRYEDLKDDVQYKAFIDSKGMAPIEGVENRIDFEKRILNGIENIYQDALSHSCDEVYIVTHGGVIMHLLAAYSEQGGTIYNYLIDNGGVYIAEYVARRKRFIVLGKL